MTVSYPIETSHQLHIFIEIPARAVNKGSQPAKTTG